MTTESATTTSPDTDKPKRWPKHAAWMGFVITLIGVFSYFMYFFQFAGLRDFPVLNLPIVFLGLIVSGAGCWGVFRQGRSALGKGLAGVGFVLALGFAGLFNFYIFSMSYGLPESAQAAATQKPAPDFTLLDHNSRSVSLSDFRGKKVVLVFYRGFW